MKVYDTIYSRLRWYPFLYDNRSSVLNGIFTQSSWQWKQGQLVGQTINKLKRAELVESPDPAVNYQRLIEHAQENNYKALERGDKLPYPPHIMEKMDPIWRERAQEEAEFMQQRLANLDELTQTRVPLPSINAMSWPGSDRYVPLLHVPDDVRPDWLEACYEFIDLVLNSTSTGHSQPEGDAALLAHNHQLAEQALQDLQARFKA